MALEQGRSFKRDVWQRRTNEMEVCKAFPRGWQGQSWGWLVRAAHCAFVAAAAPASSTARAVWLASCHLRIVSPARPLHGRGGNSAKM